MRKSRAAVYVAALASILAVLFESFQESDISSIALVVNAVLWLAVLFIGEEERKDA